MSSSPFSAAPFASGLTQTITRARDYTLDQLENHFGSCLPSNLFPKASKKANSRDRIYTRWRTVWCAIWQGLNPEASARDVVYQLYALFCLRDMPLISFKTGGYCRARARLPLAQFSKALSATADAADQRAPAMTLLGGRPIKVVDGSAITLPDSKKNRGAYPPVACPQKNCFPMMRIVVFFGLLSGTISSVAQGSLARSELSLLKSLVKLLTKGDILVGDRGFGYFPVIALLQRLGVDFVGRTTRCFSSRKAQRQGPNDWLVTWEKGKVCPRWFTPRSWKRVPETLQMRVVKGSAYQKGYRVRTVRVVTTLLDPKLYPAQEILETYLRRWGLELCLRDIKATLGLEMLRSRSPQLARQELYTRLIAHNLVRCIMAQAAKAQDVPLVRISFKGALSAMDHFASALAQASTDVQYQSLWNLLLTLLATDLVPERPGRREPRAIKRRKNKYPRLCGPRHQFRDQPKRNVRRTLSRLRQQCLK
jgi:hypothetical protein